MKKLKTFICLLISLMLCFSASLIAVSAEENNSDEPADTYRYYFCLPEEWDTEGAVASVYWWYPKHLNGHAEATKTDYEGLYYYDIPQDSTYFFFDISLDSSFESEKKSVNGDLKFNKDKVFVIDFDKTLENIYDYSELTYRGDWYYYYGDGTFGISESKGEDYYSCRSFGDDNPAPKIETNRYYFYMPEDWDNILSDGANIYWWEGTNNCRDFWPGYPAYESNIDGLYYYDVPKDVTTIIWSNGVNDGNGVYDMFTSPSKQTSNLGTKGYKAGENTLYPNGLESFDNMVYVMDYNNLYTELEGTIAEGEWYYYYGDGEYGTTPEKGDVVYDTRQLGTPPNYKKTHPSENEMTVYFLHNEKQSPVYINYTANENGDKTENSRELTYMADSEEGILSYSNIPENSENVYFSYNDMRSFDIKKPLVHNSCFAFGTEVNGKLDYKSYLLTNEFEVIDILLGDADENGKVTIQDATAIQKHLAGIIKITGKAKRTADFNEDKFITIKDATAIQKHLAKI